MIYIILTIVTIINIFNIGLIANNNLTQNKKEKMLLATYSLAELIYILFLLTLSEYNAGNIVFILKVNMYLEDIEEVITMENDFEKEMDKNEEGVNEEIEVITEVPEEKVQVEENNIEEEKIETETIALSDLVESAKEKIFTPNSLHDLVDIIESAKINKEEEI